MENKDDEEEEINEEKVKNKDILTEEELLDMIDMTPYEERLKRIMGRHYSYLYFTFFENIYRSKIKNKISAPLTDILTKSNKKAESLWMKIYKSMKFYSREKLPILIIKYFHLKAEYEFKYIYNISKKYTNFPNKFIDIYIRKMKKKNEKILNDLKAKNMAPDIFGHPKNNIFIRAFTSKKTIFRGRKLTHRNTLLNQNENNNSMTKEEEIRNKKQLRTQIMRQVHQLKLDTMKEVEKGNNIQIKQKKKYKWIKSRFLDIYKQQKFISRIINSKSKENINNNLYKNFKLNNNINNKYLKEDDDIFSNSQKKKINDNKTKLRYLYSKENIFSNRNSNLLSEETSPIKNNNNIYYYNTQNNSIRKKRNIFRNNSGKNNRLNLCGYLKTNNNRVNLFSFDLNKHNNNINKNKGYNPFNSMNQNINKLHLFKKSVNFNSKDNIKRLNSGFNNKKANIKLLINKLEQKRNKEFLDNLIYRNKDDYNNKMYEIFKRTENL